MKSGASEFEELAEPFRRELRLHCYRMVGSLEEAEDLVQETYLRAWRSFATFEGRGSLKAWLYQIATNASLNLLARRKHASRVLPDQLAPARNEMPDGVPATEVAWLDPFPSSLIDNFADDAPDPEARIAANEAVRLAFVAVVQQLPPRQRAALLLCDVLGWSAAEAAALLGGTTASINSALQRARETLGRRYPGGRPKTVHAVSAGERDLLGRYVKAWENLDVGGLVALLKEDATYTMPPLSQWYRGREAIGGFFDRAWQRYDGYRMIESAANGQAAFGAYSRAAPDQPWSAHSLHVLDVEAGAISGITLFARPTGPRLFEAFGLPLSLAPAHPPL